MTFTKADLKAGDVRVLRDGTAYTALPELGAIVSSCCYGKFSDFSEDLTCYIHESDIVKVYRPKDGTSAILMPSCYKMGELVFERDEFPAVDKAAWVADMLKRFFGDRAAKLNINEEDGFVFVYATDSTIAGKARYYKNQPGYDSDTSIAVAYARYLGEEVPEWV